MVMLLLTPRAYQSCQSAAHLQSVWAATEVTRINLHSVEVLDMPEAHGLQLACQLLGIKEPDKRLTGRGHSPGQIMRGQKMREVERVIEDNAILLTCRDHPAQSAEHSFARQIHRHSQPREKRRFVGHKAGMAKTLGQSVLFEVHRRKRQ